MNGQNPTNAGNPEPTLEQLQKAYSESSTEGKRLAAEVRRLTDENRNLQLRQTPQTPEPTAEADAAALEEAGIDVGALTRFLNRGVGQGLAPVISMAQAQAKIPMELQGRAGEILASDPEAAETYQALISAQRPDLAAAVLTSRIRMHDAEAGMHSDADKAKQAREAARKDAAIVNGKGGRSEDAPDVRQAEQEQVERKALLEHAQAIGGFNKSLASQFLKGKVTVIDRQDLPPRVI